MSTEIKEITGRCETGKYTGYIAEYTNATISLTRFAGGKENGTMIQLTIRDARGHAYVQLTKDQVNDLQETLKECYNYKKYPSD